MSSFYRYMIPNFADIACAKYVAAKSKPFVWNGQAEMSFSALKQILASDQLMASVPDMKLPFELHADGSSTAVAGVLVQQNIKT